MGCGATANRKPSDGLRPNEDSCKADALTTWAASSSGGGSTASTTAPSIDSEEMVRQTSLGPTASFVTASGRVLQPRPLTDEERKIAWTAANYSRASSGNAKPVALWILGPSSVGKSTLVAKVGHRFGIHKLDDEVARQRRTVGTELDAVVVDGEYMRDAHSLYNDWIQSPDWKSAYPALKSRINLEKDGLQLEAVQNRKNLIIPQTCLKLGKSLEDLEALARLGYTNHIFAVVAPLADCQRRGQNREVETGKRYQALEFEQSIEAVPPMIAAGNGKYEVVRAIERSDCMEMDYEVIDSGSCKEEKPSAEPLQCLPGQCCDAEPEPAEGVRALRCLGIQRKIHDGIGYLS